MWRRVRGEAEGRGVSRPATTMTEWHRLGEAYYRRTLQYELSWPVQTLDDYLVAMSTDGGLIGALSRKNVY